MSKYQKAERKKQIALITGSNIFNGDKANNNKGMQPSWREAINNQDKYKIVDNSLVVNYLSTLPAYSKLAAYLSKRYL